MIGIVLDDTVELVDPEILFSEYVVDPQRGGQCGKRTADAEALLQKGVLHIAADGEIGV